jgi:hypothetical protein
MALFFFEFAKKQKSLPSPLSFFRLLAKPKPKNKKTKQNPQLTGK